MQGWELEESGVGRMEEDSTERDNRNWGHLGDELETQCNGNSQESIRVTLAKTPRNGEHGI